MAGGDNKTSLHRWGTLEELLLACAVNRHGTDSWDSIAMEVQNRTSTLCSLTSQHCKDKFNDLKRRYMPENDTSSAAILFLVDELRRIRVEELRREVHRRDVSIVSLELKVKRLEEERQQSLKREKETDLDSRKTSSPEKVSVKSTAAGDDNDDSSDERDNRSFNESNSTGQQKADTSKQNDTVIEEPNIKSESEIKNENDPVRGGSDPKSSHNGKLEMEEDKNIATEKKDPETKLSQLGESNELGESVGESKREEKDKEKQNSDMQSSASLSLKTTNKKKRRRSGNGNGVAAVAASSSGEGDGDGEEPEVGDHVSPATKQQKPTAVKSESLVKLLGIIRSHRLGSVFERRLRSQESERYKKLIRQHIDLRTIQHRLDKRVYSSCIQKFFRDLLLLFNNAIIFFRKTSPENLAARELRSTVLKEMKDKLQQSESRPVNVKLVKPEPKQTKPVSVSNPNKSSSTMVVCSKVKASSENASKKADNKKEKVAEEKTKAEEKPKPKVTDKEDEDLGVKVEDKSVKKKRTKERTTPISSNQNKNSNTNTSNKNGEIKHQYGGNELSSHDAVEMRVERKGNATTTRKRQGAVGFLKRMKQNSPSEVTEDDDDDNDEDESSEEESKNVKVKEEKKIKGRNENVITERITRSSRGRGVREDNVRGKRNVTARTSKKQAESTTEVGKRRRDNGGTEGGGGGGRARKRSRR